MKIYTKKGDKGMAQSPNGLKRKDDLIFELFGTIDEVQSLIGLTYEAVKRRGLNNVEEELLEIIKLKYNVLSALYKKHDLEEDYSLKLEKFIDEMNLELEPINKFILPIGNKATSHAHHARVVARRLERIFVKWVNLNNNLNDFENIAKYLNRLSDYLFVLARYLNKD